MENQVSENIGAYLLVGLFAMWVLFCMLISLFPRYREFGYWNTVAVCVFLSPVIGLILAYRTRDTSKPTRDVETALTWEEKGDVFLLHDSWAEADDSFKTAQYFLNKSPFCIQKQYLQERIKNKRKSLSHRLKESE